MSKPIALALAAGVALLSPSAGTAETAVMGGGIAPPPQGSPGPGKGVTAPPNQGAARPPEIKGTVLIPRPLEGGSEQRCAPIPCVYSDGGR